MGVKKHTVNIVCRCVSLSISILFDISRRLACMKLGSREIYQPIQYCCILYRLLGYTFIHAICL